MMCSCKITSRERSLPTTVIISSRVIVSMSGRTSLAGRTSADKMPKRERGSVDILPPHLSPDGAPPRARTKIPLFNRTALRRGCYLLSTYKYPTALHISPYNNNNQLCCPETYAPCGFLGLE